MFTNAASSRRAQATLVCKHTSTEPKINNNTAELLQFMFKKTLILGK